MAGDRLKDKIAIVTGGGSGIGRAISTRFAAEGASVAVFEPGEDKAAEAVAAIAAAGGRAQAVACDVSDQAAVDAAVGAVIAEHGRLDVLVNNAGIAHIGTAGDTAEADFDRVFSVNVKGVYNCLHAAVGPMAGAGGGVILNLASIASFLGISERFAYSASKGAVWTMTMSVARDYVDKAIRCNCICPARVRTPFVEGYVAKNYPGREQEMFDELSAYQPIGRMGTPEEIASLALFLCSDEAAFITGSSYNIDGGVTQLR